MDELIIDSIDKYVTQIYHVECKGRDSDRKEVLANPENVKVEIYKKKNSNMISSIVECPYSVGAHGHGCRASHPENYKGDILCPYSFDLPYALDKKNY